jgi:hypothetical protein
MSRFMRSLSSRVVVFSLQRPSARLLFRDASKGIIGNLKSASSRQRAPMKHDKLKTVVLSDHGVQRRYYVHKLVREAFGDATARQ